MGHPQADGLNLDAFRARRAGAHAAVRVFFSRPSPSQRALSLKRCKAGVINLAFHQASKNILELLEAGPDVARDWISYPKMGKQVEAGLATYKLDSSIIIAEAIKAKAFELAPIDAQIASLEVRRDRALARIAQYRGRIGRGPAPHYGAPH